MTDETKNKVETEEQFGLAPLDEFKAEAELDEWFHRVLIEELLARPPVKRDWFLYGCFKARDKVEIVGPSKIGKTWFLLGLSIHLAAGKDFMGIEVPRPRRVLLGVANLGLLARRAPAEVERDLLDAGAAGRLPLTVAEVRRAVQRAESDGYGGGGYRGRGLPPRPAPRSSHRGASVPHGSGGAPFEPFWADGISPGIVPDQN